MINSFRGKYRFLSNFYPSKVRVDQLEFPSVENAYQASKTNNLNERVDFICCTAGQAKKLGRKVTLRDDWEDIKLVTMELLIRQKFLHHSDLKQRLLDTGEIELVEGNWWNDTFWGVCRGKGNNHLGKILMRIRKNLK